MNRQDAKDAKVRGDYQGRSDGEESENVSDREMYRGIPSSFFPGALAVQEILRAFLYFSNVKDAKWAKKGRMSHGIGLWGLKAVRRAAFFP